MKKGRLESNVGSASAAGKKDRTTNALLVNPCLIRVDPWLKLNGGRYCAADALLAASRGALRSTAQTGLRVVNHIVDGDTIDPDYRCRLQKSLPEHIAPLSDHERTALARAAQHRLDDIESGPDEHGYDPGSLVPNQARGDITKNDQESHHL
jgi:hypothetical protein